MKNALVSLLILKMSLSIAIGQHRCFTPELISSPTTQSFLKTSGKRYSHFVGVADTSRYQTFFVRNILNLSKWETIIASRIFSSSKLSLWIDTTYEHNFFSAKERDSLISSFRRNLIESTSSYSVNPSKGILELEHEYFGEPPNVDGDSILDILLMDIKDGYPNTSSYIAGYFDPNDLTDSPFSNRRDLLYIDLYPLIKEGSRFSPNEAMSTIAHEYQHLIQSHYEERQSEYIFINEGLSEYAEILCGFTPRSGDRYSQYPNRPLLSWNNSDPIPDYSRASLWTEYLFEQIGIRHIREFVQSPMVGMDALNEILSSSQGLSFKKMFFNWTLANIINDSLYSSVYSYRHPLRIGFHLRPQYSNDTLPSYNSVVIPSSSCYLVEYPLAEQVVLEPNQMNEYLSYSALINGPSGSRSIITQLASDNIRVSGLPDGHTSIQLLVRNDRVMENEGDVSSIPLSYLAYGKKSDKIVESSYDDGIADVYIGNARYLLIDSSNSVGVAFVGEHKGWLRDISVKCIFLSEVEGSGVSQGAKRDLQVQIYSWRNGHPDTAITPSKLVTFVRPVGVIGFEKIPLDEYFDKLSTLKDTFCVVLNNDINDNNYFAIGMDSSETSHSYMYDYDTSAHIYRWTSFDVRRFGDRLLGHLNAMVRCNSVYPLHHLSGEGVSINLQTTAIETTIEFSTPYPIDSILSRCVVETPQGKYYSYNIRNEPSVQIQMPFGGEGNYRIALSLVSKESLIVFDTCFTYNITVLNPYEVGNNYPNPFNGNTTFPLTSYASCNTVLQVFNILGQLVYSKNVEISQPGISHIPVNLSRLPTAVYFAKFTITGPNSMKSNILIKKIVLIK